MAQKLIAYANGSPVFEPEESETRAIVHGPDGKFASGGGGKMSSGGVHYTHANNSSGAADKASAHAHEAKTSKAHHAAAAAHTAAAKDSHELGLPGQAARHLKKADLHSKAAKKLGG